MDENYDVQDTDVQDTIPEMSVEDEDTQNDEYNIDTPDDESLSEEGAARDTDDETQNSVSEKSGVTDPFISVRYNHKNQDLTREEAIQYIQKGMHTESLRAKLEYLAASQNTDVNTLVEKLVSAKENGYRKYLESMYGDGSPEVEIGMEIFRAKQTGDYKKIMSEKNEIAKNQSINSRLADEYITLKAEMPDAPDYNELPDSVIIEAAQGKRDLYDAYLRYLHKEKRKIDAAKHTQEAAAFASSGAMRGDSGENMNSSERNFLSGLWGK